MAVDPLVAGLGAAAQNVAAHLVFELVKRLLKRGQSPELTKGDVERMVSGTADRVAETLGPETARLSDHERRAAVAAVRDSLVAVSPITVADAFAWEVRPESLAAHVWEHAADVRQTARLDEAGEEVYKRILAATCYVIVQAVKKLEGFSEDALVALLQSQGDLQQGQGDLRRLVRDLPRSVAEHVRIAIFQDRRDWDRLVEELARNLGRDGAAAQEFERRYLDHIVRTLGQLELFGVSRGGPPQPLPFERAYVSLAVTRSGGARLPDDDEDLTGAGVDVASAFGERRRVLLRGGAGAGKTTLLRWLAVSAARDTLAAGGSWGGAVPFFVPLRQYARRDEFPNPEDLPESVAGVIAGEMPSGWVNAQLRAGRAWLLVDGVDELEPGRRPTAREWLEQLMGAYPDIRFVVSARPFAIAEDWLASAGFVTFDVLPFSPTSIGEFVGRWHDAAREQSDSDQARLDWLDTCEEGLRRQLDTRVELRRLAGNPLLCGLLCALNQEHDSHLARDRKGLYDAALDLLLVRWVAPAALNLLLGDLDERKGVQIEELPALTMEEQTVLLQRFAYSLVKNHEVAVTREDATQRFAHAMRGLRSPQARADLVLQRILERTGLLRESSPDEVQFVHRTFRDYLAAKEIVDAGDLDFLVEQAHLDHWHDVVVNAVAHARPRERERVLRRLLAGNAAARGDERIRNRLHLVAAACLEHADVLDTDETRAMVQQAAARLIPPATLDDADLLARAGHFVLDLLPGPKGLTARQAAYVVRAMAMIGGKGIWERLKEFVHIPQAGVIDQLLQAWRQSEDPEGYAREVLADVEFGDRTLDVRNWHRVRGLPHLRKLTSVVCYGDIADLGPFAAMPQLRRLELVQNDLVRDLSSLATSTTLRTLVLRMGCAFLKDLSPLAETTVEELGLYLVKTDLRTLRPGRLRRLAVNDARLRDGLHPFAADLALQELILDNLPRNRNLLGVERWQQLEHVSIWGTPRPEEVEALAQLPRLAHVTLCRPDPAGKGLAELTALPSLRRLDLAEVPEAERSDVRAALGPLCQQGVEIYIDDHRWPCP